MQGVLIVSALLAAFQHGAFAKCTGDSSGLPDAECNAWQALFDSTSGTKWMRCSTLRSDPCSCQESDWDARFVSCVKDGSDASIQHIDEISMYGNTLNGTLPVALKDLPALRVLSVLENTISGALDASLCSLPKLEYIYVGGLNVYSAMTGGIPNCLFVKPGIKGIWLRNTKLGGAAPAKFASSLVELGLEGNDLTGPLPTFNYSQFTRGCNLKNNAFSCPLPTGAASACEASCKETRGASSSNNASWSCECASSPTSKGMCYTRWRCCTDASMVRCDDKFAWGDKLECKDYCDKKSDEPPAAQGNTVSSTSPLSSWSCECASSPTSTGECYTRWRCCTDSNMTSCDGKYAWGDKPECKAYCDKKTDKLLAAPEKTVSTTNAHSSWSCECASSPTSTGLCYTRWRCCTDSNMTDCDEKYAWGDKPECNDYCDKKGTTMIVV